MLWFVKSGLIYFVHLKICNFHPPVLKKIPTLTCRMPKSFKRQSSTLVVLHCSFDSGEVFELVTVPEPCSCRSGSFSYFHLCLTWSLPTKILYGVNSRRNQLQWMINVSLVLVFFGLSGLVRQCTHNTGWRLVPTPLSHKVWTTIRFVR